MSRGIVGGSETATPSTGRKETRVEQELRQLQADLDHAEVVVASLFGVLHGVLAPEQNLTEASASGSPVAQESPLVEELKNTRRSVSRLLRNLDELKERIEL